ncbi:MAG TPA: MBL fold metallo-hydrolase [Gammaproteobacteria bacterium]|nr:MBL fold metallo-hydrolase [Gammaproteobacteria bacterium]
MSPGQRVRAVIAALFVAGFAASAAAQPSTDAPRVIARAASALGGADQLRALRTIRLVGYGQEAYQDGGSKITTEPTAPEKMTNLTAYQRLIDLQARRTRVSSRQSRGFVFAARAMMEGRNVVQALDGNVAFDVAADGAARRASSEAAARREMELLANPVVAVREALDPKAELGNVRAERGATLVDVTTASAATFTLAVDDTTGLPLWVRWVGPHENLGELTYRAEFSGYEPVSGVLLPMSFNTVSDFKDTVMLRLHVDRYVVNGDIGDLAAPASVRAAPPPVPAYRVDASSVAPGVWLLSGNGGANSVLLEFADHLAMFEVPTSRGWTEALIEKARSVVPGKPITEAIVSHHHFDHTGGLRPAIAAGMTIVTQRGNVAWFEELARRPVTRFPDALSRNPRPIKIRAVDDHLELKDSKLTVELYHTVANGHMAHGLMAYVPAQHLLIQGDLFDVNWEVYFWGTAYEDNVRYRNLVVERDVPIHGRVLPIADVRAGILRQTRNAAQLCARVDAAGLSMPGCPLAWNEEGSATQ